MNQKSESANESLNSYKNKIIEDLQLKSEPIVFYGDEAVAYIRNNVPDYKNSKKVPDGYFHYENLPEKYADTGIVCICNKNIGTLAHELCHAKQFQDNNKLMKPFMGMKILYKILYPYYPPEIEAFNYAINYLKENDLKDELVSYEKHVKKVRNKHFVNVSAFLLWGILIVLVLIVLVMKIIL